MDEFTAGELEEARRPIASLISKSAKALQRLAPGTWQHAMLQDNLRALSIASALANEKEGRTDAFAEDDLQDALAAFASMIRRTEEAQPKFQPGTSHYSLLRNRLKALRIAEALVRAELERN